jgi:hypothetical protein
LNRLTPLPSFERRYGPPCAPGAAWRSFARLPNQARVLYRLVVPVKDEVPERCFGLVIAPLLRHGPNPRLDRSDQHLDTKLITTVHDAFAA